MFKKTVIVCLIINLLAIITVVILRKNLPPIIPLFYGLPVSEEQLTSSLGLIIPGIVSLVLIAINYFLAQSTKDEFIEKILTGLIISTTALALITVIKTIILIGSFS
jgi:hypothetical protein